jgi:hypothetical protein
LNLFEVADKLAANFPLMAMEEIQQEVNTGAHREGDVPGT